MAGPVRERFSSPHRLTVFPNALLNLRYTGLIDYRITIPIYGPAGLRYAVHAAIEPRLDEVVAPPPILDPPATSPAVPDQPLTSPVLPEPGLEPPDIQINVLKLEEAAPELTYRRSAAPTVLLAADLSSPVRMIGSRPGDFAEIEHEGLIVALAEASVLEVDLFDSVGGLAKELGIERLPIYVRRLG